LLFRQRNSGSQPVEQQETLITTDIAVGDATEPLVNGFCASMLIEHSITADAQVWFPVSSISPCTPFFSKGRGGGIHIFASAGTIAGFQNFRYINDRAFSAQFQYIEGKPLSKEKFSNLVRIKAQEIGDL